MSVCVRDDALLAIACALMIRLDLRDCADAECLAQVLAAADALAAGRIAEAWLPDLPPALLEALEARGLRWCARSCGSDGVWMAILRPPA